MQSHLVYQELNDKYGPLARIGPNDLLTNSTELLAHMNSVRSNYTRTEWYYGATRFEPGRDHIFSELDEEKHTKRRQQMAAGYSGKENLALETDIDDRIRELLHLIRAKCLSTAARSVPVDLGRKIQYFTLDVISTIGFGESLGDLKADSDMHGLIEAGEQGLVVVTSAMALGLTPMLRWPPLARLLGPSEKDKSGHGRMKAIARGLIDSRLEKPTEGRSDMLASFMRHGLSREQIICEAILQIIAGSDTTATAIRSTMLYLIAHPRIYNKLQAEIDDAVSSGNAYSSSSIMSDAALKKLPYLQAVVREGLRIHPALTDVAPKKVPPGGDRVVIEGKQYYLPEGTNIGYNVWAVHRSKDIFGDDAEQFRPERWLLEDNDANKDRLTEMRRTTEMIFGYGKYQCLGKPIAWMEITKVIFELLKHFDWALATPEKPWRTANYMGVFVQDEMWVLVTERGNKQ